MARLHLTPKGALIAFIVLAATAVAQMVWWIILMAHLVDAQVEVARRVGADPVLIEQLHREEVRRQVMVGLEGVFFLVLIIGGAWLIYRSLVRTEQLKFHQQNFLMAVTHELKTPLSSIKLYIDTLKSPKIPEEKKAGVLPRMREDLDRLERLVDNILEAGRFERSGYKLHRQPTDLGRLVERRLGALERTPKHKPLHVTLDLAAGVIVNVDCSALERAIDAVLENSLKYNDKAAVDLAVSLARREGAVHLVFADNGIGLERGDLNAIFERFYRVGSEVSRRHPGSGLGLYLAREFVRAHGGEMAAESEGPGLGARFVITMETEPENEEDPAGGG